MSFVPRAVLEEKVAKNPNDAISALFLDWDAGKGLVGTPDQLSNKIWPEWNPKKAVEMLQMVAK